jgi:hypothetical protein
MPKLQSVVLREGESIDHFKAIEIKFNDENWKYRPFEKFRFNALW